MKYRSRLSIRIEAVQRLLMCNLLSGILPLYIVTAFPKSGGSWFSQMLADYLEVPFPRNRSPQIQSCVMQGHYLYSPFFRNVFCVIRDGRDVLVSAYFYMLFPNDRNSPYIVTQTRREVSFKNYDRVEENMPAFIDYMFTSYSRGMFHFRWDEFIKSWADKNVPMIKYEDLLYSAADTLYEAIGQVTGEEPDINKLQRIEKKYSFENLIKRKPGEEDRSSFLRKGVAGDWKNYFTRESCEVFDYYAGQTLIDIGYESNRDWIGLTEM